MTCYPIGAVVAPIARPVTETLNTALRSAARKPLQGMQLCHAKQRTRRRPLDRMLNRRHSVLQNVAQ